MYGEDFLFLFRLLKEKTSCDNLLATVINCDTLIWNHQRPFPRLFANWRNYCSLFDHYLWVIPSMVPCKYSISSLLTYVPIFWCNHVISHTIWFISRYLVVDATPVSIPTDCHCKYFAIYWCISFIYICIPFTLTNE